MKKGTAALPADVVAARNPVLALPDPHAGRVRVEPETSQYVVEHDGYFHTVSATTSPIADDLLEGVQRFDGYFAAAVVQSEVLVWDRGDGVDVQCGQEGDIVGWLVYWVKFLRHLDVLQKSVDLNRSIGRRHGNDR
jgi:hypothetical protein